jgi:hypothetical protein
MRGTSRVREEEERKQREAGLKAAMTLEIAADLRREWEQEVAADRAAEEQREQERKEELERGREALIQVCNLFFFKSAIYFYFYSGVQPLERGRMALIEVCNNCL